MKYALWILVLYLISCGGAGADIRTSATGQRVSSEPHVAAQDTVSTAAADTDTPTTDTANSPITQMSVFQKKDDLPVGSVPVHTYRFEVPVKACDGYVKQVTFGPELITLPHPDGSVAIDDVSLSNWLEECPTAPLLFVPDTERLFDQELFKHNLMCAIMWGNLTEAQDALDECTIDQSTEENCPPPHKPEDPRPVYRVKKPQQCADKAALQNWIENPPNVTLGYDRLSICGTITSAGYHRLSFLLPHSLHSPEVKRYEIIALPDHFIPPLGTNDGWWVCVTEGRIIAEPEQEGAYGRILIVGIESVQDNGEKGME
jgi:hypothetical protein